MDHHQDRRRREPLRVTPLQTTTTTIPSNNNNNRHHQYRQLERIVTPLHPIHDNDGNDNCGGEVETILEALYETNDHHDQKLLWRRVVVQSSTASTNNQKKMVHASFLLPQVDDNDDDTDDNDDTSFGSRLAWTTFAEQNGTEATPETSKSQPVLCVLAAPTLLCLYHVHPSTHNSMSNSVVVEDAHTIPLPFRAARLQALTSCGGGLLLQRQASVVDQEELQIQMQQSQYHSFLNSKEEASNMMDDNDGFVLQAPPKPVRTTTPMNHSMTTNVNHGVPSLFSLQHPLEDVLPVLWLNDNDDNNDNPTTTTTERMVTDVFETVLFCGSFEWEDETNDHDQQQLPICVTYHQHLKRYVHFICTFVLS